MGELRERGALWSRWICAAPLGAAAVVLGLALLFARIVDYEGAGLDSSFRGLGELLPGLTEEAPASEPAPAPAAPAPPGRLEAHSREMGARIAWALSGLALGVAFLGSLAFAWRTVLSSLGPDRRWLAWSLAVAVLALGVFVWSGERNVLPRVLQVLVDDLSPEVKRAREVSKGAAVASIVAMLVALCALLVPGAGDAGEVSTGLARLRRWLYVAAGLLVAGVLEVALLLHWPAARLSPAEAQSVARLAATLTTAAGTLLTMLLAITYGIALWILRERALSLAPSDARADRTAWLAERGFDSTIGQHLVRVVALLAPLVAGGPLSALLESLT